MKRIRVNIRATANIAEIRREKRGGRDKIIVPSATLPDGVVMNGIMYPADEIERSYATLNETPAPLGHPTLDGMFCSASHTEAMIRNGIGAYNENVRRVNGRVFLDKVIDVEFASRTEGGKAVLEAIENGQTIHTSTGLLCELENAPAGAGHRYVARNMFFDHDAILLDEPGAATPEQGVGMLVNKAVADGTEIEVINSAMEDAERELDWAADYAARAAEKLDRVPLIERIKSAILDAIRGAPERETSSNKQEIDMAVSDEQFKALSDEVKTLSEGIKGINDAVTTAVANAVKPLVDAQNAAAEDLKARDEAEKADLVEKVVNANLLDKEAAEELSVASLRKQAERIQNRKAAPLNGAFRPGSEPSFKLPEGE